MPTRTVRTAKKQSKSAPKRAERIAKSGKKSSRRKRLSGNTKRILGLLLLFTLSGGFLLGLGVYKNLTKNFASASSGGDYFISERDIFSLLYVSVEDFNKEPFLATNIQMSLIDKNNNKVVSYSVPLNLTVDVPGKFGEEEINKVFALGNLNNREDLKSGISLLDNTVTSIFGFKVDKYIIVDSNLRTELDGFFEKGTLGMTVSLNNLSRFQDSMITDLTFNEFMGIYFFVSSLPQDRFIRKSFEPVYIEDPSILDDEIKDLTFDSSLSLEKKSIAVLNGAGIPGLAQYGSRLVQNLGGRVVGVGNASQVYTESFLVVDESDLVTTSALVHSFGIKNILLKENAAFIKENEMDRADVVVIMGLDIKD